MKRATIIAFACIAAFYTGHVLGKAVAQAVYDAHQFKQNTGPLSSPLLPTGPVGRGGVRQNQPVAASDERVAKWGR